MIAMTSCVKWLAVPGPTPGPWEASKTSAESNVAAGVAAIARGDIQRRLRDEVMTISCDRKFAEDTLRTLRRF